jgi:hypothetical protein
MVFLHADDQPIVIAAENGHTALVKLFLEHSFSNDSTEKENEDEAVIFRKAVTNGWLLVARRRLRPLSFLRSKTDKTFSHLNEGWLFRKKKINQFYINFT